MAASLLLSSNPRRTVSACFQLPPCGYSVAEVMMRPVRIRIGRYRRAEQAEPQQIAHTVISVFGFIDQTETIRIAKIGPAQRRNFEAGLLPAIIPRGWPFDGSIGNLIGCEWARRRQRRPPSAAHASHANRCR
jgi:hypothetical protein